MFVGRIMEGLTKREENLIRSFVEKRMKSLDLAHNFEHVECVVRLAKRIGKIEGANLRIVVPAAYFHDVNPGGRSSKFSYTTRDSAKEAEIFLKRIGFSLDEIKQVKEAIISASRSFFTDVRSVKDKIHRVYFYEKQAEKLANIIESFNKALSRANNKREIKAVFDDFLGQLSIFGFLSDALHGMLCWTGSFITGGLPPLMPGLLPPKTVWHLGGFIQSFGAGRVDIPYYGSRVSSKGVLLRPIWWQYGVFAFTKIRDAHLIMPRVDTYLLFGRHSGFMLGFVGLYIKIPRLILRDIHFFLGWSPLIRTTDYGLSSWL